MKTGVYAKYNAKNLLYNLVCFFLRSPLLAIDPPVGGLAGVTIKYSIISLLPIDGVSPQCGKLYLCNLGIPDKFYADAGIRYRSPFGHKFVIPIHLANDL